MDADKIVVMEEGKFLLSVLMMAWPLTRFMRKFSRSQQKGWHDGLDWTESRLAE